MEEGSCSSVTQKICNWGEEPPHLHLGADTAVVCYTLHLKYGCDVGHAPKVELIH